MLPAYHQVPPRPVRTSRVAGAHRPSARVSVALGLTLLVLYLRCGDGEDSSNPKTNSQSYGGQPGFVQFARMEFRLKGSIVAREAQSQPRESSLEGAEAEETEEGEVQPPPWTPMTTLAEQWGLLGFLVGLIASLGGLSLLYSGLDINSVDVENVLEYSSGLFEQGVETVESAGSTSRAGQAGQLLARVAAAPELLELAAGSIASASAVGLASGYAGLVVGGSKQKTRASGTEFLSSNFVASLRPDGELSRVAEQRLRALFEACDETRDGFVETSELIEAFRRNPDVAGFFILRSDNLSDAEKAQKLEKLFALMDADSDDAIAWPEFRAFCVKVRLEAGIQQEDRPQGALMLALRTFEVEWRQLLLAASTSVPLQRRHVPRFVPKLVLSNEAVLERERVREDVPTPLPVKVVYDVLCKFIDIAFEDRPVPRFWFLETVARMPYFAYTSVLHMYETFGWWRSPELRAVHLAEEDNELHHLLIMESLGGDQRWFDRFLAQHGAVAYYWILVAFFIIDPRWSYNFSRLIEMHAIDTYGEFVDANEERLRKLPPPPVAVEYYRGGNLYLFDRFQTSMWDPTGGIKKKDQTNLRRPPCSTLYDVFSNIRDDEEQHVLTMQACEEWVAGGAPPVALGFNFISQDTYLKEVERTPEGREAWKSWSDEVNAYVRTGRRGPKQR